MLTPDDIILILQKVEIGNPNLILLGVAWRKPSRASCNVDYGISVSSGCGVLS